MISSSGSDWNNMHLRRSLEQQVHGFFNVGVRISGVRIRLRQRLRKFDICFHERPVHAETSTAVISTRAAPFIKR